MMTAEEKYLFDLHGFIVLRGAVAPEDVRRMHELGERWHALPDAELPPPLMTYDAANRDPKEARAIIHADYGDEVFGRLCLNREIMRCVIALTQNSPQLLDAAHTRNTKESHAIPFHGGTEARFHHPACMYQAFDDQVFATFLNAAVSLVDVPEGVGFVCVPGSHKAHFKRPAGITVESGPPAVVNVCPKAGDVVLFTENLCHGARRWTADYPRQTVFVRYCTSYASWSPGHGPMEAHRDKLTEEHYELHQQLGWTGRKRIVKRMLAEMGDS